MTPPRDTTGRHSPARRWWRPRAGLAGRLFIVQLLVILVGAATLGAVALAVAPGIYTSHLDNAGERDPGVRMHAEEAFDASLGIALAVGTLVSFTAAAMVSIFVVRRLAGPVIQLAQAADALASGDYASPIPDARLGAEFERLTTGFTQMAAKLARTETVRRRLMSDLAHELRTPLSTLRAHVDGLDDGVVVAGGPTWQVLRDQLDRLQRLATDLAQLSAAEEHALSLRLEHSDLASLAVAAVAAAGPRYRVKGVDLVADTPCPVPAIADTVRIPQVLANLLDNALRYTPPGGRVTVRARYEHGDPAIDVVDNGAGLPPGELEAVFDRFHRVDASRARTHGGSGLGLTIARAIVADHGGVLSVISQGLGTGATFTLRLPAPTAQPEEEDAHPEVPPRGALRPAKSG